MAQEKRSITVKAPVNIAVIKYWGKTDEKLILPTNDSISGTLSIDHLHAMTSIMAASDFSKDQMWLNGEEVDISANERLVRCLGEVRARSSKPWKSFHVRIVSKNNFPTAAGLASSAAGYACLVYALGNLFGIENVAEISILARMGSGSACRSVYGGFVQWITGVDSATSIAKQIVPASHWPAMRILVLVVSDHKKDTSSTSGMKTTVATSSLYPTRVKEVVPQRVEAITHAIINRDFNSFAEITMKDSNQFHALCQDTWPPIRYMNDISWSVVSLVHKYNEFHGTNKVAYTFDAGPNACLYMLDESVPEMMAVVKHFYPCGREEENANFIRGIRPPPTSIKPELLSKLTTSLTVRPDSLKYVISTKIGEGPQIIENESLISPDGNPI